MLMGTFATILCCDMLNRNFIV